MSPAGDRPVPSTRPATRAGAATGPRARKAGCPSTREGHPPVTWRWPGCRDGIAIRCRRSGPIQGDAPPGELADRDEAPQPQAEQGEARRLGGLESRSGRRMRGSARPRSRSARNPAGLIPQIEIRSQFTARTPPRGRREGHHPGGRLPEGRSSVGRMLGAGEASSSKKLGRSPLTPARSERIVNLGEVPGGFGGPADRAPARHAPPLRRRPDARPSSDPGVTDGILLALVGRAVGRRGEGGRFGRTGAIAVAAPPGPGADILSRIRRARRPPRRLEGLGGPRDPRREVGRPGHGRRRAPGPRPAPQGRLRRQQADRRRFHCLPGPPRRPRVRPCDL